MQYRDRAGNVSAVATATITLDTAGPVWPTGAALTVTNVTDTGLHLSWPAATDPARVAHYELTRAGQRPAVLDGGVTDHNVSGLTPTTGYDFSLVAIDTVGNRSLALAASVTTAAAGSSATSDDLIDAAVAAGQITAETGLL